MERIRVIAVFLLGCVACSPAQSDPAAFYTGKQIQMVVGYGPGGGYDVYTRLLARHMAAHFPGGATIVVQNMPGAGSLRAANYIAQVAPRDGTVIAAIDRVLPFAAIISAGASFQFDPQTLNWIGSLSSYEDDAFILWARKDGPAKSVAELQSPEGKQLHVGIIADGSTDGAVVVLLRERLRLNIKMIPGYPDSNAAALAVERKEIDARMVGLSSMASSHPAYLEPDSPVFAALAFGRATRHPRYPNTPTALELAPDEQTRKMIELMQIPYRLSRPYVSPPDVPAERVAFLRTAFMATVSSEAFLEEAKRLRLEISPLDGQAVASLVESLVNAPAETLTEIRSMIKQAGVR